MTTYSKKYFNEETQQWEPLYSTEGRSAYETAKLNGYTGTEKEFNKVLSKIPVIISSIESYPTEGSKNLITSGGVYQALKDSETSAEKTHQELLNEISNVNSTLSTEIESKIPTIPNVEISMSGTGNVITSIDVDASNKHKIAAVKGISVYSESEIDEKLSNLGDVIAEAPFTTADRVITSGGAGKTVKDSGILLTNLATKEFVNQFEPEWNKIANKPSTFTPSAHTHTVNQITDFPTLGALASKDKVDESDLNFNIPEGVVVDSALSATSENPVQNKVITNTLSSYVKTADLNVTLGNYYTTNEVYTKEEVNDKIASAGGGDVMASGDLATDYIIVGAGAKSVKNSGQTLSNLALKSEIPSLSGYATQSWVTSQGYSTENTWRPVKVGSTTLNDSSTTLTIANGTGIGLTFVDGTLTITNNAPGSAYTLPIADPETLGGIKTGFNENLANIPVHVDGEGCAYVAVSKSSVVAALQYTPADVNDIPEIPITLPNPYALNITAGGSTTNYTGSSASTINLDSIFSKPLASVDTPGKAGIFYGSSSSYSVSTVYVTSSNPDAVIVVPTATTVTFGSNYVKMSGLDDLTGGSYKCYCITYINTGLVLVNGAIYG